MKVMFVRLADQLLAGLVQDLFLATGLCRPEVSAVQLELSDRQIEILSACILTGGD